MTDRILKVNQLFKKEIGRIMLEDVDFPDNVLVTITEVSTTPNLIESRVYISCLPENKTEEVFLVLSRNIYHIQKTLNKKLNMRPIPKIIFKKEKKIGQADKIESILEQLKKEGK